MDTRTWTIAELAREFGVTARTLRFYEEHGLLEPERHAADAAEQFDSDRSRHDASDRVR